MFGTAWRPRSMLRFDVSGAVACPPGQTVRNVVDRHRRVLAGEAGGGEVADDRASACRPDWPPMLTRRLEAREAPVLGLPGPSGAVPNAGSRVSSVRNGAASGTTRPADVARVGAGRGSRRRRRRCRSARAVEHVGSLPSAPTGTITRFALIWPAWQVEVAGGRPPPPTGVRASTDTYVGCAAGAVVTPTMLSDDADDVGRVRDDVGDRRVDARRRRGSAR